MCLRCKDPALPRKTPKLSNLGLSHAKAGFLGYYVKPQHASRLDLCFHCSTRDALESPPFAGLQRAGGRKAKSSNSSEMFTDLHNFRLTSTLPETGAVSVLILRQTNGCTGRK